MTTHQKVIGSIALGTVVIFVGGIFLMSKSNTSAIPDGDILARNGLHWHPALEVYINGNKQEIPANIGLGAVHEKIHTHEEDAKDGVIHLEMSGVVAKNDTKLSKFFSSWGKVFNANQIMDKQSGVDGKVKMLVNGTENTEFENYLMKDKDKIEIRFE